MNYMRTAIVLAGLTGLFMAVGYLIGGGSGALIALIIAAATNLFSYWKSDKLSFYSGKDKTAGWQATLERYRKRYQGEGREMGQLSFSELEIDLLGPDSALVRGRWQVVLSKDKPSGLFTLLVKKLPEGWRIVHDHTSKE